MTTEMKADETKVAQNGATKSKTFEIVSTATNEIPLALVFERLADLIDGVAESATVTGKKGEGEPMLTVQSKKVQKVGK